LTVPLDGLETEYRTNFAGKRRTSYLTPVRGTVTWLSTEPIRNYRLFVIVDEDTGELRCRLHENVPVAFSIGDEVLAFVRLYLDRTNKISSQAIAYMVV